ncbi:tRNA pseudouridine(55) synthase TruB [Dyadobacter fanqingshengii]|uniref:tRNA pseudouridine synthase B n=1 Tax=Dyadobacter fanqingshengii TaxID=2906443 RepID=A0A9X1P904_9BACT|nr:tRNA pseudouridine(55) synthase TruB [Dyadobacter fanqingshengii]MCF0040899.1 tRNA pseudouridine(55) synthase TruB [Dyadobacter fanqingshengii]USJ37369.1 tRNA pseudouridine(55) synthase TruB [Dyadobacter fanqingshengii]
MNNENNIPDEGEVILIDKPLTWTSFDVANKLKRACKFKKIGHAGTLDPLATGLLILCTGKKTKQIDTYQAQEKEYTGTLVLGKTTPSIDLETAFDAEFPTDHITPEILESARLALTGSITQVPPIYSALRVDGERLYKKARRGEEVEIKKRNVEISLFEIDATHFPLVDFKIICSKGTYIRSMVRDFGQLAGSGAYLSALCRTRIGAFELKNAWNLTDFIHQKRLELKLEVDE